MNVNVAGTAVLAPAGEITLALEEMIYAVTSGALRDADMPIDRVSGAVMAASDLYDGRAISTMTLTGSTGSFGRSEMRVCNDSLAALLLGAADVAAGAAEAVIVCSWSKLSDASRDSILPLGLEPVFHRGLGMHPDAIVALRRSQEQQSITTVLPSRVTPADAAVALVLTPRGKGKSHGEVTGLGASNGPYLEPGTPLLGPLQAAAQAAMAMAGKTFGDLAELRVAGLHLVHDDEIARALATPRSKVVRQRLRAADLGYAAGLLSVEAALSEGRRGTTLIVSAGGLGLENAFAAVVETV